MTKIDPKIQQEESKERALFFESLMSSTRTVRGDDLGSKPLLASQKSKLAESLEKEALKKMSPLAQSFFQKAKASERIVELFEGLSSFDAYVSTHKDLAKLITENEKMAYSHIEENAYFFFRDQAGADRGVRRESNVADEIYLYIGHFFTQFGTEALIKMSREKPDFERLKKLQGEHNYSSVWTNRLSVWRFVVRFIEPFILSSRGLKQREDLTRAKYDEMFAVAKTHSDPVCQYFEMIEAIAAANPSLRREKLFLNPLYFMENHFPVIYFSWKGFVTTRLKKYKEQSQDRNAFEDIDQYGLLAFLFSLEKHAMLMIGNPRASQWIQFHRRLEWMIKKIATSELPSEVSTVRVPFDSQLKDVKMTFVDLLTLDKEIDRL